MPARAQSSDGLLPAAELSELIALDEQAVETTPAGAEHRPKALLSLASSLTSRYAAEGAEAQPMGFDWYDNPMEAVVDQAGRIVLPKFIRDALGLLPGTKVDISPYGAGVQVVPAGRTARLVEEDGVLVSAGDTPVDDDVLFGLIDAGRK